MIVLDTHAWLWWINGKGNLSPKAIHALSTVSDKNPVMISAISTWEVYMLVSKGRLEMGTDVTHWIRECERASEVQFIPIDNEIVRISANLPKEVHDDPADRLIIATAISLGATLITKDAKIRASNAVKTLW
jgi:PIN domain nuclease of toxin-antitoxin system